jgi:F-type H+-transporting ATPase subunit gamma
MASLKDLKNRIDSVKSTKKITGAMKLVAAAKLRRAREAAEAASPYAMRMQRMLETLSSNISPDSAPALMAGNGRDKVHLLVVVSADRGLCGGFNTSMVKAIRRKVNTLTHEGKEVKLFCLGRKVYEVLKGQYGSKIIGYVEGITKQRTIPFSDAQAQAEKIVELFESEDFDVCTLFYSRFVSAISQEVTARQIIPLALEEKVDAQPAQATGATYEFEPSEAAILKDLVPRNLSVQVFNALLENAASEQGARMTAMDNATRNAGDMIKKLTLVYNRTRQAAITKELIEIISGAEAI